MPSAVGGETEGEVEGGLLSEAIEELRCSEVELFAPVLSWESGESPGCC